MISRVARRLMHVLLVLVGCYRTIRNSGKQAVLYPKNLTTPYPRRSSQNSTVLILVSITCRHRQGFFPMNTCLSQAASPYERSYHTTYASVICMRYDDTAARILTMVLSSRSATNIRQTTDDDLGPGGKYRLRLLDVSSKLVAYTPLQVFHMIALSISATQRVSR